VLPFFCDSSCSAGISVGNLRSKTVLNWGMLLKLHLKSAGMMFNHPCYEQGSNKSP
jgi:hypothetical protein